MIDHFYFNIQGWFLQEKLFTQMVLSCNDTDKYNFLEIGSWKGKSSSYMAVEILNSHKNITFHCVDTWYGSEEHRDKTNPVYEPLCFTENGLYHEFIRNIDSVKSVINPIKMDSLSASKLFENNSLDFVFIDGAHDYHSVKEDIKHWYPKVKRGGYIAGDDYVWPDVNRAVTEFFDLDRIIPIKTKFYDRFVDQTWLICK
jgi:predicted O-methyltransferase YrrM